MDPSDRFSLVEPRDNLCFLCLQQADNLCGKCGIPYCDQEHFSIHYNQDSDYCYPFRVLQRPGVSLFLCRVLSARFILERQSRSLVKPSKRKKIVD